MLRCARDARAPRPAAAWCEESTYACGRIRSLVSGLLLTMKTATRTCEPSARAMWGQAFVIAGPLPFIPAHSASKTRVNALMLGIQSQAFELRDSGSPLSRGRTDVARRRRLFCRPGLRAAQRCSSGAQSQTAFELQCRLKPGPGHFQQDLPVALRFGVAGPTHALLRELAEFCGGCGHGALYAGTGGSATGLSATGACVRAAGDKSHDITAETVAIAVSRCQAPERSGSTCVTGHDEKSR
jgi:hypothetical protein